MRRIDPLTFGIMLFSISISPASGKWMPAPALAQETKPAGSSSLSAEEIAGKKLFLQRCSFCHMPQRPAPLETVGPHLEGLFQKGSESQTETLVRNMILNGNPGPPGRGMPGFWYGLSPSQIDKIIAYLKTLRK